MIISLVNCDDLIKKKPKKHVMSYDVIFIEEQNEEKNQQKNHSLIFSPQEILCVLEISVVSCVPLRLCSSEPLAVYWRIIMGF